MRLIVRNGSSRPRRVAVGDGPPPRTRLWPTTATVELGAQDELAIDQTLMPRARGPRAVPGGRGARRGAARPRLPRALASRPRPSRRWPSPDVIQLRERSLLPSGRRIGGLRAIRAEAVGREFESLREYVRGDDYRRISWKATARRGRPVVATYRPERRQTLLLAVEAGRLMVGGGGEGLDKLDRSVNAAVMLAAIAREYDDAVGVTVFSDRLRAALPAAARPGQLRRVLDSGVAGRPRADRAGLGAGPGRGVAALPAARAGGRALRRDVPGDRRPAGGAAVAGLRAATWWCSRRSATPSWRRWPVSTWPAASRCTSERPAVRLIEQRAGRAVAAVAGRRARAGRRSRRADRAAGGPLPRASQPGRAVASRP